MDQDGTSSNAAAPVGGTIKEDEEARERMIATLRSFHVGHLAIQGAEYPYVIPVNHTYHEGTLIIHCALTGRKIDMLRENPKVCYGVYAPADGMVKFTATGEGVRSCQKNWESVLCFGTAEVLDDLARRRAALGVFARDYRHAKLKHAEEQTCSCIEVRIEWMTGRYSLNPEPKVIYLAKPPSESAL
jgi:uncharacterized protein